MICPNCEKEIEPNIAQCPHCGCHFLVRSRPIHSPIPVSVVEESPKGKLPEEEILREVQDVVAEQVCPECGKRIAINMQFCKWCGSSLFQVREKPSSVLGNQFLVQVENNISTNICKSCGRVINSSALFCKWCGSPCNDMKSNKR